MGLPDDGIDGHSSALVFHLGRIGEFPLTANTELIR
jgi:hypothetical protein